MNLLIVDTETTSINPDEGELLEIGAILFNTESKSVICQASSLINIIGDNKAYNVNKIKKEAHEASKKEFSDMVINFVKSYDIYDYVVAHNAKFDREWLEKKIDFNKDKKWICTKEDFNWGDIGEKRDLVNISLNLGVPVVSAHRALTDCQLIAKCFENVDNLEYKIQNSILPRKYYKANTTFSQKDKAKSSGFSWDASRKIWAKKMTEEESRFDFGFSITMIDFD